MQNYHSGSPSSVWKMGFLPLIILLGLGIGLCIWGLIIAQHRNSEIGTLLWGLAAGILFMGIWIIVMHRLSTVSRKLKHRKQASSETINTNMIYVATYARQEGWIIGILAVFFGILTIYLTSFPRVLMPFGLFCFCCWYSIRVFVTKLEFTAERIIARRPWLKKVSEPYSNIVQIRSRRTSLSLSFSSGKSLKIPSDLGDHGTIIDFLEKYCPILPNV
jgi:hypothetical protein